MRLKRIRRDQLALRRVRRGRGHVLVADDGSILREPELVARIKALGIPPAWQDVRVAHEPHAHIQACGTDAAGRIQYIYHGEWTVRRDRKKTRQLMALSEALPRIRRAVQRDLQAEAGSRLLAIAIGVALIDRTAMRVGRERYLATNGTRGAGTLYCRDVNVNGEEVCVTFPAKSGKTATYCFTDARLSAAIASILAIPGKRLLQWRDAEGKVHALNTSQINAYLREASGVPVTAKDFRTLHASAMAGEVLAAMEPATAERGRKKQMAEATRQVASFLQNTPAVCRASYIAPCLFTLFERGRLARLWTGETIARGGLRIREARLAAVLGAV
ncbi:DNA topoisomerase-1 [Devosia enhydra]|uniref:DNA topoisomerase n=1 Tax=Devosia enhydra TaxID=665118 RepID=A0A1K2HXS8_9HYPH|nr:DNA topoisomerase IB [Devosia enhydra]SFZ83154.1 DNA topoisomerase-1 [Devosia enhydra]